MTPLRSIHLPKLNAMNTTDNPSSLMSAQDYRDSLRRYKPRVFVDGRQVDSVADERAFQPGINAVGLTYDFALQTRYAPLMTAVQHTSGRTVNRLSHLNTSSGDLLNKLEAVRLICQETGCAQRYPTTRAAPPNTPTVFTTTCTASRTRT